MDTVERRGGVLYSFSLNRFPNIFLNAYWHFNKKHLFHGLSLRIQLFTISLFWDKKTGNFQQKKMNFQGSITKVTFSKNSRKLNKIFIMKTKWGQNINYFYLKRQHLRQVEFNLLNIGRGVERALKRISSCFWKYFMRNPLYIFIQHKEQNIETNWKQIADTGSYNKFWFKTLLKKF